MTSEEVKNMIAEADEDGDKRLNYAEVSEYTLFMVRKKVIKLVVVKTGTFFFIPVHQSYQCI